MLTREELDFIEFDLRANFHTTACRACRKRLEIADKIRAQRIIIEAARFSMEHAPAFWWKYCPLT